MSRIDEALRRITGAAAEPRGGSGGSWLKRFSVEKTANDDDASHSVPAGSRFPSEHESASPPRLSAASTAKGPGPARAFAFSASEKVPAAPPVTAVHEPADFNAEPAPGVENEKLIDFKQVANYSLFLAHSIGRHKMLAAGIFLTAVALTLATVILLPKTYHAETKLLAQRNAVMAALSNPGRSVPWDADAPTRAAAETILRRDNLIELIKQTNLVAEWERTRAPILKARDAVMGFVFGNESTPEEKLDAMVDQLTDNMVVAAGPVGDGTVTIGLDWPDAQTAFNLVKSAYTAFLVARQAAETAAINESIGILENYSTTLHTDIERTVGELQHTKASRRRANGILQSASAVTSRLPIVPSVTALLPPLPSAVGNIPSLGADFDDPELPRFKAAAALKRQELAKLEDARQQQLSELQNKLGALLAVYTPTHPSVQTVQHNLAALSQPSPQMAELKLQADRLESDYQKRAAAVAELEQAEQLKAESSRALEPSDSPREDGRQSAMLVEEPRETDTSDEADFTAIRLRLQLNQLMSVLDRADSARIELAVSTKAFKYRYTVITPAQVPKSPIRPHAFRILGAGLFGGLILALIAVGSKDLLSNRILEQWQIERQLGLPVLGTPVNV